MDLMKKCVLLLLLHHTGAALEVSAPTRHVVTMGSVNVIPCEYTVEKPPVKPEFLAVFWLFQEKEILRFDNEVRTNDSRYSLDTKKAIQGRVDLSVSDISLSDAGVYTCKVLYSPEEKEMDITLVVKASPQVTITDKTVVLNAESILRCSAAGFYPVDIDIKWFRGSERLSNVTEDPPLRNQDGLYNVNSTVTITPTEEDREQIFSCRVQHESLLQPHQETFQLLYGVVPTIHILPHTFIKNVQQTLVCLVSGFYPESIVVNWILDGTPMEKTEIQRINGSAMEAVLHLTPTEEIWGREVSCVVEHETLLRPKVESLTVLGKDLTRNYLFAIIAALLCTLLGVGTILFYMFRYRQKRHPKLRNITPSADGSFSLNVDHFYPEEISVSWEIFQPPSSRTSHTLQSTALMQENQDGTYNVISTTESLRGKVDESEKYSLRAAVTHKKLRHPSYREWTNQHKDNTRFQSPPELGEILAPSLMLSSPAQLQCTISRFYPDHLTVTWVKKVKGNEEIIETCEKYKITPHRSLEQRDKTFTCTAGLTFTPTLEDQESEIICRVTHPDLQRPAERSTGQLQVRVKPTSERPIQLSITDSGDVTAALSLLNFYPKDIMITWSYGQSQEKKPSEEKTTDNPDGTFSINTKCNIPGEIFNQKDWKIKVTWKHETMEREESREMCVGHEDYPWCPKIVEMSPLILQMGKETTVTCKISKFFPDNLMVTWYKKTGVSVTLCPSYLYKLSSTPERSADNSYSCSASLSFTATSQPEDLEFICKVSHPSLKDAIERSTGKALTRVIPQMEKPVKFTLSEAGRVRCRTKFKKFYPSDIKISWTNGGDKPLPSTRKLIQTDGNQTCDATSECEVPWDYFSSGVRVTWEHESMTPPQHQDLCVKDLPWRPDIAEIVKPDFFVNTKATLQCKISQYFPNNLTVTWHKKRKGNLNLDQVWSIAPTAERQPDNTYSCTTSLTVTPTIEDNGAEYICRAQHPSLEQHIQQTTGPIHVSRLPSRPTVSEIFTPIMRLNEEVTLRCDISRYFPQNLTMSWLVKERGRNDYSPVHENMYQSKRTPDQYSDSGYRSTASLHFRPSLSRHHGVWIMCKVTHPSLDAPIERSAGPLFISLTPELKEAPIITPCGTDEVLCSVKIRKFFPKKIKIAWTNGENCAKPSKTRKNKENSVMTSKTILQVNEEEEEAYDAISECRIPQTQLRFPLQVTWKHESMAEPQSAQLNDTDLPWRPIIEKIDQPVFHVNTKATLQCKISQYFPSNLPVTWYKKKGTEDQIHKTIPNAQRQPDNTYICTASLTVTPSIGDNGAEFICRMQHPSLEHHIQQTTGPIQVYARPTVSEIFTPIMRVNEEVTLRCDISGYLPQKVAMSWLVKERGRKDYTPAPNIYQSKMAEDQYSDSGYRSTASLHFRPSLSRHHGVWFMCKVTHPSLDAPIERSAGPLLISLTPELREGPSITPCGNGEVLCSVKIRKFFPKKIKVTWKNKENSVMPSKTILLVNEEEEEAYDAISECRIPQTQLPLRVTWEHESMEKPESVQLNDTENTSPGGNSELQETSNQNSITPEDNEKKFQ
ncbi:uncharacterized protein ACNLHF_025117 isoform 1-T1 [Anomaloglossus baeobatrachus]